LYRFNWSFASTVAARTLRLLVAERLCRHLENAGTPSLGTGLYETRSRPIYLDIQMCKAGLQQITSEAEEGMKTERAIPVRQRKRSGRRRRRSREEFSFLCKGRTPWKGLGRSHSERAYVILPLNPLKRQHISSHGKLCTVCKTGTRYRGFYDY